MQPCIECTVHPHGTTRTYTYNQESCTDTECTRSTLRAHSITTRTYTKDDTGYDSVEENDEEGE